MLKLYVILGVFIVVWMYYTYIGIIKKRNKVQEAFSSVDVQLKLRYDLIPNILTIAQKFMEHEKNLIKEVTELRTEIIKLNSDFSNMDKKFSLDNEIANKMNQIIVAAENYPQLKSDSTMIQAMQTYSEVESHIAAARRFYNSAANDLKNAIEIFPSSIIARLCNIRHVDFFKALEKEKLPINASDFLK